MTEENKQGWFSRRNKTQDAYLAYRQECEARVEQWRKTARENEIARNSRTPTEQLLILDKRLGKNVGAVKERKRLHAQNAVRHEQIKQMIKVEAEKSEENKPRKKRKGK